MLFGPHNFLTHIKNLAMGGGRNSAGQPANDSGYLKRLSGTDLNAMLSVSAMIASLTNSSGGVVSDTLAATTNIVAITDSTGGTGSATFAAIVNPAANAITSLTADVLAIKNALAETATQFNAQRAANITLINDVATLAAKINQVLVAMNGTADETNAIVTLVQETVDTIGTVRFTIPRDYDEATDVLTVRVLASQLTSSTDNDVQLDSQVYRKRAGAALTADLNPTIPSTVLSTTEQWVEFSLTGNSFRRDDVIQFKLITDGHNDTDGEEVLIHDFEVVYRSTLVSYDELNSSNAALR